MRNRLLLAVVGLLLAATPGAPPSLAVAQPDPVCVEPTGSPLARAADGRTRERDTRAVVADTEIPAGQAPATASSFTATVPVWFHVIAASTRPRDGWVSDRQLSDQLQVLDRAFAGGYGGADSGFRFVHAGTTRTIDPEWFAMETFEAELEAKRALRRGDATTLNVYINSGGGYLGWAYYPKVVVDPYLNVLDGAVVHFGSLPGGHVRDYDLGHTATHEVGHWLGLAHTFEGGCQGHGDRVDDTPAQASPTSGCPVGRDSCASPGLDPVHNFMDYSHDDCYSEFTAGQSSRAQAQYLHWRVKVGYN